MDYLRLISADEIRALTTLREGEVRIGQRIGVMNPGGKLPATARIVILGVPEDIGVRANMGRGGARQMWRAFLPRLLNMQSNRFLDGNELIVAGCLEVRDLNKKAKGIDPTIGGPHARAEALATLRELVNEIDARLATVINQLRKLGLLPVVIGGGHNNAYGILAGCAQANNGPMNCVNIDLHADLRPREGRHSGNPFTYALANRHLERYAVIGMSEAYATHSIIETIEKNQSIAAFTFESMLRSGGNPLRTSLLATEHVGSNPATLELDLDSVAQAPASASAASGFTAAEFRGMAMQLAAKLNLHAVHIAEGAPRLGPWKSEMLGKFVAELVRDVASVTRK